MKVEEVIARAGQSTLESRWDDLEKREQAEAIEYARQLKAALDAAGYAVVPKEREFICQSCFCRAEEGKPERTDW